MTSAPDESVASAEIGFSSYVGRSTTRGYVNDISTVARGGFGVFAYETKGTTYSSDKSFSPNFMDNIHVETSSTSSPYGWHYRPLRYWPSQSTEYLSFLAYYPYDASATLSSGSETSTDNTYINYAAGTTVENQKDLLIVATTDVQHYKVGSSFKNTGNVSDDGNVKIAFHHACSRIGFTVTSSVLATPTNFLPTPTAENRASVTGDAIITVNKVILLGDNSSAANESPTGAFSPSAKVSLLDGTWTGAATEGKLAFTFEPKKQITATASWDANMGTVAYSVDNVKNGDAECLFIIPQNFTSDNLYVYLDYTVRYTTGVSDKVKDDGANYKVYKKIEYNFEGGKAYNILMDIGGTGTISFVPITVTVENVPDWGDEDFNPLKM